jgi:hypothetical protein
MDYRVSEIRRQILALRVTMLKAEDYMRKQINRDEECSLVAEEILHMRAVMSELVRQRAELGDREPILVNHFVIPRRSLALQAIGRPPTKRKLIPRRRSRKPIPHFAFVRAAKTRLY